MMGCESSLTLVETRVKRSRRDNVELPLYCLLIIALLRHLGRMLIVFFLSDASALHSALGLRLVATRSS